MANTNTLLDALPADVRQRLRPLLTPVQLRQGQCLLEAGESCRDVYFPGGGWVALELTSAEGDSLEMATIGRDGIVGAPLFLEGAVSPYRIVAQADCVALRARADELSAAMLRNAALRDAVMRFSARLFHEIAQVSLCQHSHTVLQRLSRWLLTAADHLGTDTVPASHERLTHALGVTRSAVSHAITELHSSETIWSRRGAIALRNRRRLQLTACECYNVAGQRR